MRAQGIYERQKAVQPFWPGHRKRLLPQKKHIPRTENQPETTVCLRLGPPTVIGSAGFIRLGMRSLPQLRQQAPTNQANSVRTTENIPAAFSAERLQTTPIDHEKETMNTFVYNGAKFCTINNFFGGICNTLNKLSGSF